MDKKTKLSNIYEVIARKDLSMGCLVKRYENTIDTILHVEHMVASIFWCLRMQNWYLYSETTTRDNIEKCTIIWHPVMLGDVLYYRNWMTTTMELVQKKWRKLRDPIDNQSDECINYVFSLLPTPPWQNPSQLEKIK